MQNRTEAEQESGFQIQQKNHLWECQETGAILSSRRQERSRYAGKLDLNNPGP